MALSIEQLKAFVETVEQGSFRKAAIKIGKHSSTISEQVANLEIDLGFSLFERSRRGIELTGQGQEMYKFAQPILLEAEFFLDKADSMLAGKPQRFTLALDTALRCPEVSECYRAVIDKFPGIDLQILSGDAMQIMSWLRSGRADVGLVPTMLKDSPDITYSRGFAFTLDRIVGRQVSVNQGSLESREVRGIPQILHSFMVEAGHVEVHQTSNHSFQANNANEIIEMVAAGIGWALAPGFLAAPHIASGRVQKFQMDNARSEIWFSEILHLSSNPINPAMKLFIDLAKKIPDKL